MSKNKIEFGQTFNFKNQFLRDKSIDDIKSNMDLVEGAEVLTYTVFKYATALVAEGTIECASRLLKVKGVEAAHNSSLVGIVIDGDEEVNDQIREDMRFVRDAVTFSMSDDNERKMIQHLIKFEKTLTTDQRRECMDKAYAYKNKHECSMVEARYVISKNQGRDNK